MFFNPSHKLVHVKRLTCQKSHPSVDILSRTTHQSELFMDKYNMSRHGKDMISDQEDHDQEVTQLDCHARIIKSPNVHCTRSRLWSLISLETHHHVQMRPTEFGT